MDKTQFLDIIELTPLVSIDLIIENDAGEILLGKRTNKPAQGFWFVPGGRIRKNERLSEAFQRITVNELGVNMDFDQATLLGAYDHIYQDNAFSKEGVNTHYVALGYKIALPLGVSIKHDAQHSALQWQSIDNLMNNEQVHINTKNYFS